MQYGENAPEISNKEKIETILRHLKKLINEKGEDVAVREMRKHIAWYVKGLPESTKIREKVNTIKTEQEIIDCLTEYFNQI